MNAQELFETNAAIECALSEVDEAKDSISGIQAELDAPGHAMDMTVIQEEIYNVTGRLEEAIAQMEHVKKQVS